MDPTNPIHAIDAIDAINAMNLRPKGWTLDSRLILWERLSSLDDHGQKPVPTYHLSHTTIILTPTGQGEDTEKRMR